MNNSVTMSVAPVRTSLDELVQQAAYRNRVQLPVGLRHCCTFNMQHSAQFGPSSLETRHSSLSHSLGGSQNSSDPVAVRPPFDVVALDIVHNQPLKSPQQSRHILTSLVEIIDVRLGSHTELVSLK